MTTIVRARKPKEWQDSANLQNLKEQEALLDDLAFRLLDPDQRNRP